MIEVVFELWMESLARGVSTAIQSDLAFKYVGYSQAGHTNTEKQNAGHQMWRG